MKIPHLLVLLLPISVSQHDRRVLGGTVGVGLGEAPPEVAGGTQGTGGTAVVGPTVGPVVREVGMYVIYIYIWGVLANWGFVLYLGV